MTENGLALVARDPGPATLITIVNEERDAGSRKRGCSIKC